MTKTRTARGLAAIAALCVLVLTFCVPAALAASYSKVYGKTTERVRVREKASTNATVIDNIVKDACVYVTDSETSGSSTFVQVKYRASDGTVATGWICQSDGSTTYVRILTNDSAKSSYGVSGGNVPSKVVGTFTSAQRESAQKTASSSYIGSGSSGTTVRDVQTKLKALGFYSGEITGNVGSKTEAAIKAFQQRYGLTADGIAGPQTIAKIDAVYASSGKSGSVTGTSGGNIQLGSSGTDVAQLQRDLKTLGYYAAEITGNVGAKTQTAIKEFQRKNGLTADGVAGSKTLAAIAAAVGRSAGSGTVSTGETLRLNSSGSAVSALQQNLATLGIYGAEVTGHYGSKTEAAVRKFQSDHGLTADGIAGPKTLTAIASAVTSRGGTVAGGSISGTLKEGSSGADVTSLQNMLKALGYYYGEVTGHFGSLTKKAVKKFQEDNNLTVDGIAGAGTINRLRSLTGTSSSGSGSNVATGNSYGRITKDNVRLHTSYSTSSDTRATLAQGTLVRITKVVAVGSVNWYYVTVSSNGYKGYVRGDMMETITAAQYAGAGGNANEIVGDMEVLGVLRVKGENVRLRSGPDTTYSVVEHANAGDILYFVNYEDGWFETRNGLWINEDYITELSGADADRYLAGTSTNATYRRGDSGAMVEWIQEALTALEFYGKGTDRGGSVTGSFGTKTEDAVKDFQEWQNLPRTGVVDAATLSALRKATAGNRGDINVAYSDHYYWFDWFTYKSKLNDLGLKRGQGWNKDIMLTDLRTGISMYVYVQYTGNHADLEPLTQEDTNALCDMFGVSTPSQISYNRRMVMLTIKKGDTLYQFPGAVYGVPHSSEDNIADNGYSGQFCLHMCGTKTNGTDWDNPNNSNVVKDAKNWLDGKNMKPVTAPDW